ncbi:hypothetical protein [Lactiplantibacillus plantarum]|uniref:hypothetical protein n=1 Tax=Lactiplantibacillus plantarum TaxID=1590 RepID=UPI003F539A2C
MDNIEMWLSIVASILGIIATIVGYFNHKDLVKMHNYFGIGSENTQSIKHGNGNVQQTGIRNQNNKESKSGR